MGIEAKLIEENLAKGKPSAEAPRKSCLLRLVVGCGCLTMGMFVTLMIGSAVAVFYGYSYAQNQAQPYLDRGYQQRTGQLVSENKPVEDDTVYVAQVVRIREGTQGNVAFVSQVVEVEGEVKGDLEFFGQVLTLKEGATIQGKLFVKGAQSVIIQGTVEGDVDFSGQALVIHKDAIVKGNLHIESAQRVVNNGTIEGEITGNTKHLSLD